MKAVIGISVGQGKMKSEDAAFCNQAVYQPGIFETDQNDLICIGVADGVGGNAGGCYASQYVSSKLKETSFQEMDQGQIREEILKINLELLHFAESHNGREAMATTLTAVVKGKNGYYLIQSGNTRLYVFQGAYLRQVSEDQTTYQWLIRHGQYEAAENCNKSEIVGCMGGANPKYAEMLRVEKIFDELPNSLLLTSDGVHDYVDIDQLEGILQSSEPHDKKIQILFDTATNNGSVDDKTVIVVRR